MKYLLKIFVVSVLTCCVTARVSCANNGTKKAIQDRDKFHITVKNHQGIGISGLKIETTNLVGKQLTATTNSKGVATFENACEGFAKVGRTQFPVQIKITDSFGKYKAYNSVLWFDNFRMGCEREIKLPKDSITYKFPPADQLKGLAFNQRTGELKFYSVCDTETKIPSRAKGECVNMFMDVNTQYQPAVELVQEYVYEKIGPYTIQCQMSYRQDGNNDYLACTSTDGKYVFEFEFDDLVESVDDDMRYGTLKGLCTLYGGRILQNKQTVCRGEQIKTEELCNKLKVVSDKFVFRASYEQDRSTVTPTRNYYCYVDFKIKTADESVKTYPGLDPFIFQSYQMKFDNSIKVLIGQYVESTLGDDFISLQCASMTKAYYGNVRGTSDDIIECDLITQKGSYNIEFVFDDLTEFSDTTSQGDKSKMTCLTNDGTYVAGRCVGVSEAQCTKLGQEANVKVNFNSALNICELSDAATQEGWNKVARNLESIGWATLAVLGVIFSGGTAIPALMALGAAATVANSAIAFGGEINKSVANNSAAEVLGLIAKCKCDTECANGICKACESCDDCDANEIYSRLPYAITFAEQNFVPVLENQVASIQSCIKPEQLDGLKRVYNESLDNMRSMQYNVDTASNVTAWMSLVTPSNLGKTLKTATTISKTSKTGKAANTFIDSSARIDTWQGMNQSDSTSTTQPTKGK